MDTDKRPIVVVQGAQWGSEGKGGVVAKLCQTRNIDMCVRTGGINAGHTVIFGRQTYKMQQLPCGWVNPHTELVLGAGALIRPEILAAEIDMVDDALGNKQRESVRSRLIIDKNATVHCDRDAKVSSEAGRHLKIGATGKGVSEAIAGKIVDRGIRERRFSKIFPNEGFHFMDTAEYLNNEYDDGGSILIEGTQGNMLDLHHGPWPFVTGRATSVSGWLADLGLSPRLQYEIVAVVRTYPIRVAGNSGPMPGEISWSTLIREMNEKLAQTGVKPLITEATLESWESSVRLVSKLFAKPPESDGLDQEMWRDEDREKFQSGLSEIHASALRDMQKRDMTGYEAITRVFEMTTVTKKLRRIARMSTEALAHSFMIDRPSWIALTFLNYEFPQIWGIAERGYTPAVQGLIAPYLHGLYDALEVPIRMITTGPDLDHHIGAQLPMERGLVANV